MSNTAPLYGLVLAGGQSTRMGRDKGLLNYHGQAQRLYLAAVLQPFCAQVFLSLNAQQAAAEIETPDRYIVDAPSVAGHGPMTALLSAHLAHPSASWMVVTCDLPFFDATCATTLIEQRNETGDATAFLNASLGEAEPWVAIYERRFLQTLPAALARGDDSLRRLLRHAQVQLVQNGNPHCWLSADRPEDYAAAKRATAHPPKPTDPPQ